MAAYRYLEPAALARVRNLKLVDAARFLHGADNFVEFVHFTARGAGVLAAAISDALLVQSKVEIRGGANR